MIAPAALPLGFGLALALGIAAPPQTAADDAPSVAGDCAKDPAALEAAALELLLPLASRPPEAELERGRAMLRAARRGARSARLDLLAADLAFLGGDAEEEGDLLASAADAAPRALATPEWLRLARRADERRRWNEALLRYDALRRSVARDGDSAPWISARMRELELEAQAAAIAAPQAEPPVEARLALADGKRELAQGRLPQARERLQQALRLSPGYVDALLTLSAVETRAQRPAAAIRFARQALAADPGRAESLSLLAALLWAEPGRDAKQEALGLSDRVAQERPEEPALLRLAAERYAQSGDSARALERLDRYAARVSPRERAEVAPLREALLRQVAAPDAAESAPAEIPGDEAASGAVDRWRKAQVLAERGDGESLASALALLAEAETLDPSFAAAPELAAAIHRRRGEMAAAEAALVRAIREDPTRASAYEGLARLREDDPARRTEAPEAWRRAAEAGSTEALFQLARAADAAGDSAEALSFYRRYRDEAPAGLHAAAALDAVARLETLGRRRRAILASAAAVLALAIAGFLYRRRSGRTLAEWLADFPGRVHRVRPVVGRLRHEALKHGSLLLPDAIERLGSTDPAVRRDVAALACGRLYGVGGARGLVDEGRAAIAELTAIAREDGVRLDLPGRDPAFSEIARGLDALERARPDLERTAASEEAPPGHAARAAKRLERALRAFERAPGAEIDRLLDRASALPVRIEALESLLRRVAEEAGLPPPTLERLDGLTDGGRIPNVRIAPLDWETLWRNLFANAVQAGRARAPRPVRLGVAAQARRDPSTGEARLRMILADDAPGVLAVDVLRARPPERGWGVIAEILRRNDAAFDVLPEPSAGFTKGIALDLPAIEAAP